ncbi:hypothetical protein AN477_08385 [Alicyclobacillus ferrooxydans]|uniref:Uncharacterized protein n=1 Tax=Alicyclobacillus ferrooxydans TaxID=471514 RepID=A0A0P9EY68_9BACL|nr:hypothetical protein AN477_08385 [Alicyclobacillus ferrooxydans]
MQYPINLISSDHWFFVMHSNGIFHQYSKIVVLHMRLDGFGAYLIRVLNSHCHFANHPLIHNIQMAFFH